MATFILLQKNNWSRFFYASEQFLSTYLKCMSFPHTARFYLLLWAGIFMGGTSAFAQRNKEPELLYSLSESDREVTMENASVLNTNSMEFAPIFYNNGLVFVSSRRKFGRIDESTGQTFFELYYTEFGPNNTLSRPQPFSMELNSKWHEGPVAFSDDGNNVFFTRSNSENGTKRANSKGDIVLKIYEAQRSYWDWENITELEFNSDEYSCMHPTLTADSERMYFVSDMPGGFGGLDIWFVNRNGKGWSKPINLGDEINTSKNESFPYMHESGVLFFSSDGFGGEGGLDIFMVNLNLDEWEVLNIGKPFNSEKDDFGFVLDDSSSRGYLSSSRDGGVGMDDIYSFEVANPFKGIQYIKEEDSAIDMVVIDGANNKPLDGAYVWVFEVDELGNPVSDTTVLYDVKIDDSPTNPGAVEFKYVPKQDKKLRAPDFVTNPKGRTALDLDPNRNYIISVKKDGYEGRELKYPSEVGDEDLIAFAVNKQNCMTISGSVVSRGYNTEIPGTKVTIRNDQTGEEKTVIADLNGEFSACLDPGYDYTIIGQKNKYGVAQSKISTKDIRNTNSLETALELAPNSADGPNPVSQPLEKGTVIILNDIYYDFGKSAIRTGSTRDLETVLRLMQRYPSMGIELGAFTDSRGDADFNMQLSLRRAEAAKDYLVQRGIDSDRVTAFGYGESRLRNHCKDGVECTEEEHSFNRRTEIKVTKINEPIRFEYKRKG